MTTHKVQGREAVILEAIDGGYCISAKDIAAHLYKDGNWKLDDAGASDSFDEWGWPTESVALVFLEQHADKAAEAAGRSEAGSDVERRIQKAAVELIEHWEDIEAEAMQEAQRYQMPEAGERVMKEAVMLILRKHFAG